MRPETTNSVAQASVPPVNTVAQASLPAVKRERRRHGGLRYQNVRPRGLVSAGPKNMRFASDRKPNPWRLPSFS
jgi:hypothetical protein